jgi:hypothetical protein
MSEAQHRATQPAVWLIGSETQLARRPPPQDEKVALRLEGRWSSSHPFAPWIELISSLEDARQLASRLRDGPSRVADPDEPILPDPPGAFADVGAWLERLAFRRPVVLVLHDVPHYGRDSLDLLVFLTRFLRNVPVRFLLVSNGLEATSAWDVCCATLANEIGINGESMQGWQPAPYAPVGGQVGHAVRVCRAGAVHEGARLLATALIEAGGDDCEAWQTLAMVGLWLGDGNIVATAATHILRSSATGRQKARARRTWMLSLRRSGDLARLRSAADVVLATETAKGADRVPVAWSYLDRALVTSVADPVAHTAALDRLLQLPSGNVPPACLATGLVWRSTAAYFEDDLGKVVDLLAHALAVLEGLGDFTRSQHVRTRYGITLATVGRPDEAVQQLSIASRDAVALGQFDVAAICIAEAAAALALGSTNESIDQVVQLAGWKAGRVWQSPIGRASALLMAARIACADGRLMEARAVIERLLAAVTGGEARVGDASIRFLCEAAFVQADIAQAAGENPEQWARAALEWAKRAPLEDQPVLRTRARNRLCR